MPTRRFETTVAAPLAKVWEFHQHVRDAMPALSLPGDDVRVEHADDPPAAGARIVFTANSPIGRIRWVARIVELVPPHAVVFGEEARFTDEQESGPFKYWRHVHEFEHVDEKTARIIDTVTYRMPYGPLGWVADKLLVARKLRKMFTHRHAVTRRLLE